jgi:hypothetical protein
MDFDEFLISESLVAHRFAGLSEGEKGFGVLEHN